MKLFLEYLYSLGIPLSVFDAIYDAAKRAPQDDDDYRTEIVEWYTDNLGDDSDKADAP